MWENWILNKNIILISFLLLFPAVLCAGLSVEKDRDFISSLPGSPTALVVKQPRQNDIQVIVDKTNLVQALQNGNIVYLASTSVTNTGSVVVILKSGGDSVRMAFQLLIPTGDSDRDGYPDVIKLGDGSGPGNSFRDWFCVIAESQFYQPSDTWYDIHKDCAGLIEFSYREALKIHDKLWAKNYKFLTDINRDDNRGYFFPGVPLIGRRIFRVTDGPFDPAGVPRDFAVSANGSAIRLHCMKFVSRNVRDAKGGDILFFFHGNNLKMPSHAMVYIGEKGSSDPLDGSLIYHTGPGENNPGVIKKVLLRDLLRHPDPSWRPAEENMEFVGVYKWKILN